MNRVDLVNRCVSLKGAAREQPFGPEVDVFKVMGKVFALVPVDAEPPQISLKCDPTFAAILRENYAAVTPGYHLNKRHWITVVIDGSVPEDEVEEWIDGSYGLVVKGLTKAERERLSKLA